MQKYKKNIFAITAKPILYYKEFRKITGSITATILWQQLEYWFNIIKDDKFFKYLEPLSIESRGYKKGDSWTEELGFSAKEFKTAFSKIGICYKSKKQYNESDDKFKGKMYCSYYEKSSHLTYYLRNNKQVEENLQLILETKSTLPKVMSGTNQSSGRELTKGDFVITENTTENTTILSKDNTDKSEINKKIIKKEIKTNSYGRQDINQVVDFLKQELGATPDGSIAENRRYAKLLIDKLKKDYPDYNTVEQIIVLIKQGRKDKFHGNNMTSFKYLYYNSQKIIQKLISNKSKVIKI